MDQNDRSALLKRGPGLNRMTIELLLDCHAIIAESPTWSAAEGALYWIDVKAPALHRLDQDGQCRHWTLPAEIGAFALTADRRGAVVALRTGIYRLAFDDGEIALLAPPPFDPDLFRFNDGICDQSGRFWIGVMRDPRPGVQDRDETASMQLFGLAGGLAAGADQSDLHNGFAWSGDGATLFWSHSNQRQAFRADYHPESGQIGAPRPFFTLHDEHAVPDGAAVDEDGCYWCAIHGAGALHRYDAAGRLVVSVALPVSQPTMCAFAGPDLADLVVTSASDKLTPAQVAAEPHAGGLFRLRPGVRGVARPCVVR